MNIAIAFDKNYLPPFYALITSIFNNNKNQDICFHLIVNSNVSVNEFLLIQNYIKQNNATFISYNVNENLLSQFVILGTWTSSVYYKMFFPILIDKSISKLLYLDTDMLVIGDLKPIFEIQLGEIPLAAVYDNYVKVQPDIGIIEEGKYFNSGMLLYNIPVWNKMDISNKAIEYLSKYPDRIKYVDQCALNAVIQGDWLSVSEKYNLMYSYVPQEISLKKLEVFMKDKVIIHYTLQRPWNFLCLNRLRYLYKYYLNISPYMNKKHIIDFSYKKIPAYFKIRLKEYYFDSILIQRLWQNIKLLK